MTNRTLANPRRTNLASLSRGSELATCEGRDGQGCHNVAVLVVGDGATRRLSCRAHAGA